MVMQVGDRYLYHDGTSLLFVGVHRSEKQSPLGRCFAHEARRDDATEALPKGGPEVVPPGQTAAWSAFYLKGAAPLKCSAVSKYCVQTRDLAQRIGAALGLPNSLGLGLPNLDRSKFRDGADGATLTGSVVASSAAGTPVTMDMHADAQSPSLSVSVSGIDLQHEEQEHGGCDTTVDELVGSMTPAGSASASVVDRDECGGGSRTGLDSRPPAGGAAGSSSSAYAGSSSFRGPVGGKIASAADVQKTTLKQTQAFEESFRSHPKFDPNKAGTKRDGMKIFTARLNLTTQAKKSGPAAVDPIITALAISATGSRPTTEKHLPAIFGPDRFLKAEMVGPWTAAGAEFDWIPDRLPLLGRQWVPLCLETDAKEAVWKDVDLDVTVCSFPTTTAGSSVSGSSSGSTSAGGKTSTVTMWWFAAGELCGEGASGDGSGSTAGGICPYSLSDVLSYMTGGQEDEVKRMRDAGALDKRIRKILMTTMIPTVEVPPDCVKPLDDLKNEGGYLQTAGASIVGEGLARKIAHAAGYDYTPAAIQGRFKVGLAKGTWVVNKDPDDFSLSIAKDMGKCALTPEVLKRATPRERTFELKTDPGMAPDFCDPRADGISREVVALLEHHIEPQNQGKFVDTLRKMQWEEVERVCDLCRDENKIEELVRAESARYQKPWKVHVLSVCRRFLEAGFDFSDPPVLQGLMAEYITSTKLYGLLREGPGVVRAYSQASYTAYIEPDWSRKLREGEVCFNRVATRERSGSTGIGSRSGLDVSGSPGTAVAIYRPPGTLPTDIIVRKLLPEIVGSGFHTENVLSCSCDAEAQGPCDAEALAGDLDGDKSTFTMDPRLTNLLPATLKQPSEAVLGRMSEVDKILADGGSDIDSLAPRPNSSLALLQEIRRKSADTKKTGLLYQEWLREADENGLGTEKAMTLAKLFNASLDSKLTPAKEKRARDAAGLGKAPYPLMVPSYYRASKYKPVVPSTSYSSSRACGMLFEWAREIYDNRGDDLYPRMLQHGSFSSGAGVTTRELLSNYDAPAGHESHTAEARELLKIYDGLYAAMRKTVGDLKNAAELDMVEAKAKARLPADFAKQKTNRALVYAMLVQACARFRSSVERKAKGSISPQFVSAPFVALFYYFREPLATLRNPQLAAANRERQRAEAAETGRHRSPPSAGDAVGTAAPLASDQSANTFGGPSHVNHGQPFFQLVSRSDVRANKGDGNGADPFDTHVMRSLKPFTQTDLSHCDIYASVPCPNCTRPQQITIEAARDVPGELQGLDAEEVERAGQGAFAAGDQQRGKTAKPNCIAATIWGTAPDYVLGALVLGRSLREQHEREVADGRIRLVLLVERHVPEEHKKQLRSVWQELYEVDHLTACDKLGAKTPRFKYVFSKFHCLSSHFADSFAKVLHLDLDMVCVGSLTGLFELQTPAAMRRGPVPHDRHGEKIDARWWYYVQAPDLGVKSFDKNWGQSGGINAGAMLFTPSQRLFENICRDIADDYHPAHVEGNAVEQDFISRYFSDSWHHMDCVHNFQLHQLYNGLQPHTVNRFGGRAKKSWEDLKVVHFSGEKELKPWDLVLRGETELTEETLEEILRAFEGYWLWDRLDPARFRLRFQKDPEHFHYLLDYGDGGGFAPEGEADAGGDSDGEIAEGEQVQAGPAKRVPVGFLRKVRDDGPNTTAADDGDGSLIEIGGQFFKRYPLLDAIAPDATKKAREIVRQSHEVWLQHCRELFKENKALKKHYLGAKACAKISLGGKQFDGAKAVRNYIAGIEAAAMADIRMQLEKQFRGIPDAARTPVELPDCVVELPSEAEAFFRDLLEFHPDAAEKLEDLRQVAYGVHPDHTEGVYAFLVLKNSGARDSFSFRKCIDGLPLVKNAKKGSPRELALTEMTQSAAEQGQGHNSRAIVDKLARRTSIAVGRSAALGAFFVFGDGESTALQTRADLCAVLFRPAPSKAAAATSGRPAGLLGSVLSKLRLFYCSKRAADETGSVWRVIERPASEATAFFTEVRQEMNRQKGDAIVAISTSETPDNVREGLAQVWAGVDFPRVDERAMMVAIGLNREDALFQARAGGHSPAWRGGWKWK